MAEDLHNTSDLSDPVGDESPKEDAETKATREELKQTAISEKNDLPGQNTEDAADDKQRERKATPELEMLNTKTENLKEQVSSPKKKRGHEEVDEGKDAEDSKPGSQTNEAATNSQIEPAKKRPRDEDAAETTKDSKSTKVRSFVFIAHLGCQC
jgi:Ran-binding protein 3